MPSYWLTDPELFLYAKGTGPDDVILRRCKKMVISSSSSSSSLVVPMKPDDFEYVETVKNHLELIANMFTWDEPDYKRLVKYIYEKRLLVNSQGFVIAELLHKLADKDVPAIYIRSLDVLPLKPYIPNLMERPIPMRTVKYLGDVNGKAAPMEDEDYSNMAKRVADLELKNKTLEGKVTKSNADLATRTSELANSQYQVADLELKNKTLEGKVTKLTADLEINANNKKDWMNDLTNSEWVGVEGLTAFGPYDDIRIIGSRGTFTMEDSSTNVRARYWCTIKLGPNWNPLYKAVCLEDLTLNKEMARFSKGIWWSGKSKGKTYVALYSEFIHPNIKEVWMNDLANSDWVGVEGLKVWGSNDDLTIVGSPGTFTVDDSSTNVQARYWHKIKFVTNTEFKAVFIENMTPNKEKARFSQFWWSNKTKDGKTYAYRWL